MVREFTFRGHNLEELNEMSMDDFISILPARHRRSLHRGLTKESRVFLENLREAKRLLGEGKKIVLKTHCRDLVILPEMVGLTIQVYNGKEFIPIEVKTEMIGHYLGEFSITNKRVQHGTPGIGASRSSMYVPLK